MPGPATNPASATTAASPHGATAPEAAPGAHSPDDADRAAKLSREQKDQLSEFTRELVQSVNKAAYYGADHPAHHEVGEPLYKMLVHFLADNPQVAYLLNRTTPPEIFVDGLGAGRLRMSDIMPAGVYSLFVPRFVEYFDRHSLVLLAFRNGVTLKEFIGLVSVLSRPVTPGHEFDIGQALLDDQVFNVSVLLSNDVASRDFDLPWQIRMCLARLRRDLRLLPMFKNLGHAAIVKAKRQIFQDIVRPINNGELLKQLVLNASRIQQDIAHIEGLEEIPITPLIIESLAPRPAIDLTRRLCEALAADDAGVDGSTLREAVGLCAARLSVEHMPEAEPVLRMLYENEILKLEELPADLQDWILAEALHVERASGRFPEVRFDNPRSIGLLGKLGRLDFANRRYQECAEVAERLYHAAQAGHSPARTALNKMLSTKEIQECISRYATEKDEGLAHLLAAIGEPGAMAVAAHFAMSGVNAQMDRVYHLLDRMNSPGAIVAALRVPNLEAPALRLLLTLGARHPDSSLEDVAAPHVDHADAEVRFAAIVAMDAVGSAQAASIVTRARQDADPEILTMAMAALATRHGRPDLARARALELLEDRERPTELRAVCARMLGDHPGQGSSDRDRTAAVLAELLKGEKGERGLFGFMRRAPVAPGLAEAVRAALAKMGVAESTEPEKRGFFERFRR